MLFSLLLFLPLVLTSTYFKNNERVVPLLPYQVNYTSLPKEVRVGLRELRSKVLYIDESYQEFGEWPESPDGLNGWVAYPNPTWIDYRGELGGQSIILRVIDLHTNYHPHPHPGVDYDPHDLLASQIWVASKETPFYPLQLPETGWQWAITPEAWRNVLRGTLRPKTEKEHPIIGVTLRVYYSWVKSILNDEVEVIGIIPDHADPHTFQPTPEDVTRVSSLDLIIEHGLGHDVYRPLLTQAIAFPENRVFSLGALSFYELDIIDGEEIINPHNFLSLTGAAEQITVLTEELTRRFPAYSDTFKKNARKYIDKIHELLDSARSRLDKLDIYVHNKSNFAVVHTGFNYLLQDLGFQTDIVVEPRHGLNPSAKQLADTIIRIKDAGVKMLIVDAQYPARVVETIQRESGCHLVYFSHLDHGPYGKERFITTMRDNIDSLIAGIYKINGEDIDA